MDVHVNSHVTHTCILHTFSVRQEMAYQRAGHARELQKSLQSTAEVRYTIDTNSQIHMCVVVDSPNWRANASFCQKLRHTCSTPQIHVLITISQLLIKTVFCIPYTQPTEVDCSTVLSHEGVYFSCPLCPVSALQSEIDAHLSDCLHKVLVENSYRHPSVWVQCPFYRPGLWAECPYYLCLGNVQIVWTNCLVSVSISWRYLYFRSTCRGYVNSSLSVLSNCLLYRCVYYGVVCNNMSVLLKYVH